jgi:hypothetical protein
VLAWQEEHLPWTTSCPPQDLVKQVLSALRAIAGNDDVKDAIVRAGGTESIMAAMIQHLASPRVHLGCKGEGWVSLSQGPPHPRELAGQFCHPAVTTVTTHELAGRRGERAHGVVASWAGRVRVCRPASVSPPAPAGVRAELCGPVRPGPAQA